jgi:cell division protein FtsB
MVLAGPSGLLAWSENNRLLTEREKELKTLTVERDELRNRVALLDPAHVDPDIAGELLRSNLNVVHPDEVLMLLK